MTVSNAMTFLNRLTALVFTVCTWVTFERALHLLFSGRSLPGHLLQSQLTRPAQLETEELPEQPRLSETHHEQHQQPANQTQRYPHARVSDDVQWTSVSPDRKSVEVSRLQIKRLVFRTSQTEAHSQEHQSQSDHPGQDVPDGPHLKPTNTFAVMIYTTIKRDGGVFERSLFCSPKLHSFVQNAVICEILL